MFRVQRRVLVLEDIWQIEIVVKIMGFFGVCEESDWQEVRLEILDIQWLSREKVVRDKDQDEDIKKQEENR